jgi:hypothetical protein
VPIASKVSLRFSFQGSREAWGLQGWGANLSFWLTPRQQFSLVFPSPLSRRASLKGPPRGGIEEKPLRLRLLSFEMHTDPCRRLRKSRGPGNKASPRVSKSSRRTRCPQFPPRSRGSTDQEEARMNESSVGRAAQHSQPRVPVNAQTRTSRKTLAGLGPGPQTARDSGPGPQTARDSGPGPQTARD